MKIEPEYVLALHREVTAQQGQAAVAEAKAKDEAEQAQAKFQQAIGGLAVLGAIMGRLNAPEPPAPAHHDAAVDKTGSEDPMEWQSTSVAEFHYVDEPTDTDPDDQQPENLA